MAAKYRADQVGSFLRPPEVMEAHTAHAQGRLSLEELRKVEDQAILGLLEMQKQTGIEVFSDGEWRRGGWAGSFAEAMSAGYVPGTPAVRPQFQANPIANRLERTANAPVGPGAGQGPSVMGAQPGAGRVLGEPLVQKSRLTAHESGFLKQHSPGPFKITMPAASYIVARGYHQEITPAAFGNRVGALKAVAEIINKEIKALVDEGVPYVQLDNPHYPDYVVDDRRDAWKAIGVDPDKAIIEDVEADNACLEGIDRSKVTLGMHFCRGNGGGGGWHTSGGYDRIAEAVFGNLAVDTFLLEYDTERAGGFAPLRYMPKGKTVVLGLVTTKFPELEPQDELVQRIEEAAKYVAMEDLALSPQCGFASTFQGNALTPEEQRAKLELVGQTARRVWR